MNNRQHAIVFYATLFFSYNLVYSCASDLPTTSISIKLDQARLIIGDADENAIDARIDFPFLSPIRYGIQIDNHLYTDGNPDNLIQHVIQRNPTMNQNAIPILKQFFEQFSWPEQIENSEIPQEAKQNSITIRGPAHPNAKFKEAFAKVDAELDRVLTYENAGFPELPTACSSARAAQEFPFLGGLNLMCDAASDTPVTLRFLERAGNLEAHLIIGKVKTYSENSIWLDTNAILARIAFRITEPLKAARDIIDIAGKQYMAANEDPEILIQKVVRLHPDMNQDAIPILRQFFKKFNSLEHIENGMRWQKARETLVAVREHEDEGFPEPPVTCDSAPADEQEQPTQS